MDTPNPYAPPGASVADVELTDADIESLDVSETWKKRFRIIKQAGGPGMPNLKNLPFRERRGAGFNIVAFLFGPFYYLSKGMWRKAITLFLVLMVALLVIDAGLELMGLGRYGKALGYGAAAVFAVRANIDYYKKMVLRDN